MKSFDDRNDKTRFLEQLPFWEHLSPSDRELVRTNFHLLTYSAGQPVSGGGTDCLGAIFVKRGILRVYLMSDEGKETTMYRLRDGEVCVLSVSCALSAITFEVEIEAETDCELYLIPAAVFSALMKRNIYVENYTYKLTTERFSEVIAAVERMFFMTLKQRIAAFLVDESAAQRTEDLTLTQEQLARAIGSAREAVSRSLKQLSACGCIEIARGTVRILDKKKLYQELT